tara:strand:- start:359 stop:664 length:306 start_codon:yes stop_codon:yes gene_type:complete
MLFFVILKYMLDIWQKVRGATLRKRRSKCFLLFFDLDGHFRVLNARVGVPVERRAKVGADLRDLVAENVAGEEDHEEGLVDELRRAGLCVEVEKRKKRIHF